MSHRENISYLVPRDPSIKCWDDRVKLPGPCTKNLIQLGLDEFEETMGDKIKVYLRLKPSIGNDHPYTVLSADTLQTEAPKDSVSYKNVTNGVGKLVHKFKFSAILNQDITQAALFKKCAVKSLKKFLCGENFLLMAYGTTSAGKTFTMQGNVEQPGVIPRALDFVFTAMKDYIIPLCKYQPYQYNELIMLSDEQLKKDFSHKNFILSLDLTKFQRYPDVSHITVQTSSSSGFCDSYENVTFKEMQSNLEEIESFELNSSCYKYSVWISMIEIYNEQVYDLLELPNDKGMRPKLTLRDDEFGNTFVKNLRYVNVSSGHEAFQILQFGRSNLHMAPTALNERSSRSHCIFMITLAKFCNYDVSPDAIISRFSFCDLAGLERAKKTLNVKDRLVESKAINTSLSILVKCLTTIRENQNSKEKKMIPYRESKLTKLFRDAVTGKEQFSLIVNVTTEPNLFDETLSVLKFSSIAQKIVPQNVFAKPKIIRAVKRSRFSRIVVNSSNSETIDWEASTGVETKVKEESSDNLIEELQELVENLKEELVKERKRSETIEAEIRQELTANFSEILKRQNESNKLRLESERETLQEFYERKEKRLITYFEHLRKNTKDNMDDQSEKLKAIENEVNLLKSEKEALEERIQGLVEENLRIVEECSELKLKMADKENMLERSLANESTSDALLKELKNHKLHEEAKAKIINLKSLLNEAASDYKELEEDNKYLQKENEVLEEQLTEHRETVADLKNEIAELQKALSDQRVIIEKLEEEHGGPVESSEEERNEEMILCNKELEILREQFKNTSKRLEKTREEFDALKEENQCLANDLEVAKMKIAELQNKMLGSEEAVGKEKELEMKVKELEEELEKMANVKGEAELLEKEKLSLQEKCNDLNAEIKVLQKELKDLIMVSKSERQKTSEIESLTKENDLIHKELLCARKKNAELEKELKEQIESLKVIERESKIALESLQAKFEAVEYQNTVMKNLKDEAERQAFDMPKLYEEIKRLEKEIENRDKDLVTFNENRQQVFNNYEKELLKLKEENERLRKDVLFANDVIAKNLTPLKLDKAEISRLKESVKKKDEEITKLKAEVNSIKKSDEDSRDEKLKTSDSCSSSKEDSPFVNLKKKKEYTPNRLAKQIEALSVHADGKSTGRRKKVDQLHETIHPSTVKNTHKGRKKKDKKDKEKESEKEMECEKENIPVKKKNKVYKQLFTENDFDGLTDLNVSPLEQEIPRLRPRK